MTPATLSILSKLFETHRLVFWYDTENSLFDEFESISIPEVEKLVIDNNEFGLKVRILSEEPKQKFLLYHHGPRPADESNWLLDLLLSNAEFCTDEASLILSDLDLDRQKFLNFIQKTMPFFHKASKRVSSLKLALHPGDETEGTLALKMLAICTGLPVDARIDHILMELCKEYDETEKHGETAEKWLMIGHCGLEGAFWAQMRRSYGYSSDNPSLFDFLYAMFQDACYSELPGKTSKAMLFSTAQSFLRDWRDNQKHAAVFESLSKKCSSALNIAMDIADFSLKDFGSFDAFADIDERILQLLSQTIEVNSMNRVDVQRIIAVRRNTHWYPKYSEIYEALDAASAFLSVLPIVKFEPEDAADAIRKYSKEWYKLDRFYREFIYHAHKVAEHSDCLNNLTALINGKYANQVVLPMNNAFQKQVDVLKQWQFHPTLTMQTEFFNKYLATGDMAKKKVFVIISDALRYEVATELVERIQEINRYTVSLDSMVGALPSYTKLGMAALLPHKSLASEKSIAFSDALPEVLVDGNATIGLEDRKSILTEALGDAGATAIRAEELLSYNKEQVLELQRNNRIVYVYHNEIDATGDALKSEGQVFEAAARSVDTLLSILKKLAGPNHVMNYFITSDHGFLYQDIPVADSDFLSVSECEAAASFKNRRFLLGKNMPKSEKMLTFDAQQVGLGGDVQVQIPRSVNRLHLSGSGSRFTHGGAALQEIVVPLIYVQRKSADDTSQVTVDLLHDAANRITTGQLIVRFFQTKPVVGKMLARTLRIGIYTADGKTLLSNQQQITFDSASNQADDRLTSVILVLNHQADLIKNAKVLLVMESRVGETTHYAPYKTEEYLLQRTFTNDFDF